MQPKFALLLLPALLAGCASTQATRFGTDVIAAGAGGIVADKLSNGNPYWTLTGGVTALGLAEWAHSSSDANQQKQLALAYERGKAQNAQTTYDAIQAVQRAGRDVRAANSYAVELPITAPARTINGVKVDASTEFIRVSTP